MCGLGRGLSSGVAQALSLPRRDSCRRLSRVHAACFPRPVVLRLVGRPSHPRLAARFQRASVPLSHDRLPATAKGPIPLRWRAPPGRAASASRPTSSRPTSGRQECSPTVRSQCPAARSGFAPRSQTFPYRSARSTPSQSCATAAVAAPWEGTSYLPAESERRQWRESAPRC